LIKILIVDDAKETRETLHNIIRAKIDTECEIKEAEDGLDALNVIESFQPEIVLTDIMMPKMDGIRLTSEIKSHEKTKNIFVASITGLSGEEEIKKIYASGVDFYIAKPFQLDDIVARLKVIIALVTQKSPSSTNALVVYNCYNDNTVKHYFTTFSISKEDDIFLVFDYFSKQNIDYDSLILKDFMVTLIKTYEHIKDDGAKFHLIIEESEKYIYVTLNDSAFIDSFNSLASKHSSLIEYKKSEEAFSFRINLNSFVEVADSLQKEEITPFENELVLAIELIEVCGDDIYKPISDIKKEIKEYKVFCGGGYKFNDALHASIIRLFQNYTLLFSKITPFEKIALLFSNLEMKFKVLDISILNDQYYNELMRYVDELNLLISQWIKDVIITQESMDVHYMDFQIMNVCKNLENLFIQSIKESKRDTQKEI
jgi:CheY-like chemotaxis protein